jgi:poly(hydroxyalkanoate) depolymerase family esterase
MNSFPHRKSTMSPQSFSAAMAQATALTRAGNLTEATALIQQALGGSSPHVEPDTQDGSLADSHKVPLDSTAVAPIASSKRRSPLADTLHRIARGGMPDGVRPPAPQSDPHITSHTHRGAHGARDYMLYVPVALSAAPMPVIVMLHGCTQSPQDFAAGTGMNALARAQGFIVVYPAQPNGANAQKCWNWFRHGDQRRDAGEPAILAGIARAVLADQNADPGRVYVAGLSAGGAAALILAQAYPDLFAAVGVHSGLAAGSASDVGSAFAAMRTGAPGWAVTQRVPTIVFHGTADTTVAMANAQAVAKQGMTGQHTITKGRSAKGRSYTRAVLGHGDKTMGEVWLIDGAGHAWAGGSPTGSYTDPTGPDASAEMVRFFAQHGLG